MVSDKTNFDPIGYTLVQIATILGGLRWSLTTILLSKKKLGINNPLATNLALTPWMSLSLFIISMIFEKKLLYSSYFYSLEKAIQLFAVISFGGVLALIMLLFEFQLIKTTSVITFSIAGIIKEILTISLSALILHDHFSFSAAVGLAISIFGLGLYNWWRINKRSIMKHSSNEELELEEIDYTKVHEDEYTME